MGALFSPWSDTAIRVVLWLLAAAVVAAVVLPMIYVRTPYNQQREFPLDQPVQFDHRHHVGDDAIDCRYCHSGAERGPYAGIPSTEVCMGCHAQIWNRSPMLEPVRRSYFSGQPLRWNRVHDLPDFVYFNHSIHVAKGVGCATCHGRVDRMPLMYQNASLQMEWCLDCHRNPAKYIRPKEQVFNMAWQPPADDPGLGARLVKNYHVLPPRTLTSCSTCHR
jgi:hypothetical protein